MEFEMTPQRSAYFAARGKVILNACPGSGKTTCIVHKLSVLEKECQEKYGRHAGIACLSFTNVAKNEILHKYKELYGSDFCYPHLVSTIDSFINQYITLPFYNVLNKDYKRPRIVDQPGAIDDMLQVRYQYKGKWYDGIQPPFNTFKNKAGRLLYLSYPASKIWIEKEGNFTFEGKSPDAKIVDPEIFQQYGSKLFKWKASKGIITSLDSAYIALQVLKKCENIGKWLVKKFPYIIIDEAQDNSEIQHAIFDKLVELGLKNIEMIGDPYQSLYEWRDAKPQLFTEKYQDKSWNGLPLSQNRRSVQRVINCFSLIRTIGDDLISTVNVSDREIPIIIYKYTETNPSLIVKDFEQKCEAYKFTKNHIVVRGKALRDKMLGNAADIYPWKYHFPYAILKAIHYFKANAIKDAVTELRKVVFALLHPSIEYTEMRELLNEKVTDYEFNGKLYALLYNLPSIDIAISEWTIQSIAVLNHAFGINAAGAFEFKVKIDGYKMADLKKQNVNMYFNKPASNQYNIPVTTIHQVKGATLDAILYFFDENSKGQSVSFNDFKRSTTFPSEKQRMIYVACSRPKQLLALAFPANISDRDFRQKFGTGISIVTL